MVTITKELSIELITSTTVEVEVKVHGIYDTMFGADADGNRGQGRWLVDSHEYDLDDDTFQMLSEEEVTELEERIEELVYEGLWDFEHAEEDEDDESDAGWVW